MSTKSKKQRAQAKNLQDNNFEEQKMESPKETIENVSYDSLNSIGSSNGEGPLRSKRIDEKNALIGLNNRFAAIIEKNHQLEHANNTLTKEVHKAEENLSLTVTRLETTFAKKLDDSNKLYSEAQKENAQLQMNATKTQKEMQELRNKLEKKDKDADTLKQKLALIDEKISKLSAEVQEASERNVALTKDNKDLEEEKFRLIQELTETKCNYEEECLANVDLRNQLKGRIEENNIKVQLFEQEILQVKNKRKIEIEEIDGKLKKEYELKLQELLNELRANYEKELDKNKEEQKNLYNKKENDLISQINKLSEMISSKIQEMEVLQSKFDEANNKLAALEGDKYSLNINIKELEKKYEQDKENHAKDKKKIEAENDQLRKDKDDLIGEYLDLVETKTALDNEIATYRALLEGEEERLSMSPESQPNKTDVNENVVETPEANNSM